MTSFRVERLGFDVEGVSAWSRLSGQHSNWPVVYTINDSDDIYIGESRNATARMRQHLENPAKQHLQAVRVVIDETFNKSVCLDLESHLIRLFAGDGRFRVLNSNEGITDADYFDRESYRERFRELFDEFQREGLLTRSVPEIENSDLFKLSPFKALTQDQAVAVEDILEGLFDDLESGARSTSVVQGHPGTGKTVVGIYLMKLLSDIATSDPDETLDRDSLFSDFFRDGFVELARGLRIGLVVPQQSLRESVRKVFHKTPGLDKSMVLSSFDVGKSAERYDVLVIDEAHRLNQRANQSSAAANRNFAEINIKLFGSDAATHTQWDWIREQSDHQILLLDSEQSVKPADLPLAMTQTLIANARAANRHYPLISQMRVRAGEDYVGYVRRVLAGKPDARHEFAGYDFRFFDRFADMRSAVAAREAEVGLSRIVAGYAWEWVSKKNPEAVDIQIENIGLKWNSTATDWINSPGSTNEVGSIHTVQGYDLNYAGVIIGPDLRFNEQTGQLFVDRDSYFDKKGKENNPTLGISYSDEDLLTFITNIYAVLLTRGIQGTYVYVCDPKLRAFLKQFF